MEQTLPLLFNTVDWIVFAVGIVIMIIFAVIGEADYYSCVPIIFGALVVLIFTFLYLMLMRDKASTTYVPWGILACEIVLGIYLTFVVDVAVDHPILGTILAILIPLGVYFGICALVKNNDTSVTNIEARSYVTEVEASEISEYLEEEHEIIPICAFSTGANVSGDLYVSDGAGSSVVGSGYVNTERVYIYYYENEWGIMVQDYVTADKLYSGFSRTLKEGEQPYLDKIHQYDVTVNNSGSKEEKKREYRRTLNIFYVPEDFMVSEFSLN